MHTVIYHNNCYDGVCAAWVMHKYLAATGKINEPTAKFKPCNYGDEPPWDLIDGNHVYIVDFSWKRPVMEEIIQRAQWVTVLDHHKTAEADLKDLVSENLDIVFDMNRSGAGITWDYFMTNDARPPLVDYVEDRDLWRYALSYSREYNAYIQSFDIDFKVWVNEFVNGGLPPNALEVGKALLRQQSKLVRQIAEQARTIPFMSNPDRICVFVETSVLMSEVCEQMLIDHPDIPFVAYAFHRKDGKIQYGLRSRTGSDVDVSVLAKEFGGGGHKHAAGFEL